MENQIAMGMNRTGTQMAPKGANAIANFARQRLDDVPPDEALDVELRSTYAHEADRLGSVPMPGSVKGAVSSAASAIKGDKPSVLIDKLGERLAFERSGVRLYEALITKCTAAADEDGSELDFIDINELRSIREDEETHFRLVAEVMDDLGADPTAVTPSADVAGVLGQGILQTITDPRTTVAQALNAILVAELADNAAWELLLELAEESGQDDFTEDFSAAQVAEERHLEVIRGWLRQAVLQEAT